MNPYKELLNIKEQIEKLSLAEAKLKEEILNEVKSAGGTVKNDYGVFSKVVYKNWIYSDTLCQKVAIENRKINKIKMVIKSMELNAQKTKRAICEEKEGLRVVAIK